MNDIILNKVSTIERCISRAREEYADDEAGFRKNHTRQDAAVLNIQRACEASLDLAQHMIRIRKWEPPKEAKEVYRILAAHQVIQEDLALQLQKMVGFRNIAVHEYQDLSLEIVIEIIQFHLNDLLAFTERMVCLENKPDAPLP